MEKDQIPEPQNDESSDKNGLSEAEAKTEQVTDQSRKESRELKETISPSLPTKLQISTRNEIAQVLNKEEDILKDPVFDEKFKKASQEDVEFGFRLIKDRHKIPIERKLNAIHHINLGIQSFTSRTIRLHTDEMKMYLRDKSVKLKTKQSNYLTVILGIILIFFITFSIFINLIYPNIYFNKIFITLNLIFILIHMNFLIFLLSSKGLLMPLKAIFYIYLHRFLFIICFFRGLIDFYILRKKY